MELAQIFFNLFNKITITTSTGTGINFLTFFQFFPQSFPTCIQEGKRMRIQPCPNKIKYHGKDPDTLELFVKLVIFFNFYTMNLDPNGA